MRVHVIVRKQTLRQTLEQVVLLTRTCFNFTTSISASRAPENAENDRHLFQLAAQKMCTEAYKYAWWGAVY